MKRLIACLMSLTLLASAGETRAGVIFMGLGDLLGGEFSSRAFDISADGSVVVGRSVSAFGQEAYIWTSTGGMVGLGDLPGGDFRSSARGVSADGSVVVGRVGHRLVAYPDHPPDKRRW